MNNRALLSLAWLAATIVMMIVTYSAVNLVGSAVTDQPIQAATQIEATIADRVSDGAQVTTTTDNQPAPGSPSTSMADEATTPTTTADESSATTGTDGTAATTSTTAPSTSGTTPASSSTTSSTTSTTQPEPVEETGPFPVSSGGGVITVSCIGDTIRFLGATPSGGYTMEAEEQGPEKVEVRFSSSENAWDIEVRCEDGTIDPKVELEDF